MSIESHCHQLTPEHDHWPRIPSAMKHKIHPDKEKASTVGSFLALGTKQELARIVMYQDISSVHSDHSPKAADTLQWKRGMKGPSKVPPYDRLNQCMLSGKGTKQHF